MFSPSARNARKRDALRVGRHVVKGHKIHLLVSAAVLQAYKVRTVRLSLQKEQNRLLCRVVGIGGESEVDRKRRRRRKIFYDFRIRILI